MSEEKVNVMLYGGKSLFGGRERRLEADVTYCDAAGECPLRKEGKCLVATRMIRCKCVHGRIETVKGYTSRAQRYREFKDRWESDPLHHALKLPSDGVTIMRIGEQVFLKLGHVGLAYDTETKGWKEHYVKANDRGMWICDPWMGSKSAWVPRDALDAEFFANACKFRPRTLFDNREIKDYKNKDVPMIVERLKVALPDVYDELVPLCPELSELVMDHTGRYAKAVTLRDGSILRDGTGNVFEKRGDALVCESYRSVLLSVCGVDARNGAKVEIPLTDGDTVEVKDNDWVTDGTVFE